LFEPWEGGRCFYIGIAIDVDARLKSHVAEAKEAVITLTKNPNLGLQMAMFLNGCADVASVAEKVNGKLRRLLLRTPEEYEAVWGGGKKWEDWDCIADGDAIRLDCGWVLHKQLTRPEFLRIMHVLYQGGLRNAQRKGIR
jgi:hypothetical protein